VSIYQSVSETNYIVYRDSDHRCMLMTYQAEMKNHSFILFSSSCNHHRKLTIYNKLSLQQRKLASNIEQAYGTNGQEA